MVDYEMFIRSHLNACYRLARSVLGSDEEAALAAQAMCLHAFQAQSEREDAEW
jgi:1,2-phenylacetyl-CoA epoxidase PaaB subunit